MGVHKPAINRKPAPIKRMAGMVTLIGGGSLISVKLALTASAEPATARIRSNPVPGQPPANVEYRRRTDAPFRTTLLSCAVLKSTETPKRVKWSLFRVLGFRVWASLMELQLDDPALQPDHGCLSSVVGAQLREDTLHSPLDGFFGDRELIGNLLIRISGGNQPQHVDFCGR